MAGRKRWRSRRVVFDSFDDAMFMLAMWETFPRMWVLDGRYGFLDPGDLVGPSGMADLISQNSPVWDLHFPEDGWRPIFLPEPQGRYNFIANAPRPSVFYQRDTGSWGPMVVRAPYDAPKLNIQIYPDRELERSFVNTVWRIVNRVSTNHVKFAVPDVEIAYCAGYRGNIWCGHHIYEWWCRKVYDQVSDEQNRPIGWKVPDTPWHRDMRARVIAQFGHELDEPKVPWYHSRPFGPDD
jgi:hypothetical protein